MFMQNGRLPAHAEVEAERKKHRRPCENATRYASFAFAPLKAPSMMRLQLQLFEKIEKGRTLWCSNARALVAKHLGPDNRKIP